MLNSSRTTQAWRRTLLAGAGAALIISGGLASAAVAATSPSPAGPMMGGSAGSMMGGGNSGTRHASMMTRAQARHTARTWVARHYAGAMAGNATKVHQGYRFNITRNGAMLGHVTVNTATGYCSWTS